MPTVIPIHFAASTDQPVIWAASRLEVERVSDGEFTLTRRRLNTPESVWTLTLDVTDSQSHLIAGDCQAVVIADWYLLLKTDACHRWEKGRHNHTLHHISSDGRVLWSLPWQTADQVGLLGDRLVVTRYLCSAEDAICQPPLVAHLLEPRTGRSLTSHAIPIPDDLWPVYEPQRGDALRVRLEHDGQRFVVQVSLHHQSPSGDGRFVHPLPFGQRMEERPGFVCPECLTVGSLHIVAAIALPADSRSDEIALQVVACGCCRFGGMAVYEETRRGALDSESWQHVGYRVSRATVEALRAAIIACPQPGDPDCTCTAHLLLARRDASGRWLRPDGVEWRGMFSMQIAM